MFDGTFSTGGLIGCTLLEELTDLIIVEPFLPRNWQPSRVRESIEIMR
jgi:hypothetical protein